MSDHKAADAKQPDAADKPTVLAFGFDVGLDLLYLVARTVEGLVQGILKLYCKVHNEGFIQVFLVVEEVVQGADGEFRLLCDPAHGHVVISIL